MPALPVTKVHVSGPDQVSCILIKSKRGIKPIEFDSGVVHRSSSEIPNMSPKSVRNSGLRSAAKCSWRIRSYIRSQIRRDEDVGTFPERNRQGTIAAIASVRPYKQIR